MNMGETPVQTIKHPLLKAHQVNLLVKRDDLTHPLISGNKWRKLKYNLTYAKDNDINQLISFSGAFSNHLYALAGASRLFDFKSRVIVRGPTLDEYNPCLRFAKACGVELTPVTRKEYRLRNESDFLKSLAEHYPNALIIPEGGTNERALLGVIELANSLPAADQVWCAVGSAGTFSGLIEGLPHTTQIKGVAVLKQADYLIETIKKLSIRSQKQQNWQLITNQHFGGYGKFTHSLWDFCLSLKSQIPLEPIYSGKMFYALFKAVESGEISPGSTVVAIHTGGLQGLTGLKYRGLIS